MGDCIVSDIENLAAKADVVYKSGNHATAIDMIFQTIDQMCREGRFKEINKILMDIDATKYDLGVLLSFLTITFAANEYLPYREDYFDKVKEQAIERGEYERGLLTGLSTKKDRWDDPEWEKNNLPAKK